MFNYKKVLVPVIGLCIIGNSAVVTSAAEVANVSKVAPQMHAAPSNACGDQVPIANGTIVSKSPDGSKSCETTYINYKIDFTQVHNLDASGKKITTENTWYYTDTGVIRVYEFVTYNASGTDRIREDITYYDSNGIVNSVVCRKFTETGMKLIESTKTEYEVNGNRKATATFNYNLAGANVKDQLIMYSNNQVELVSTTFKDETGKRITSDNRWYTESGEITVKEIVTYNNSGSDRVREEITYYESNEVVGNVMIREFTEAGMQLIQETNYVYNGNGIIIESTLRKYENGKLTFEEVTKKDASGKRLMSYNTWYTESGIKKVYEEVTWNQKGDERVKEVITYYNDAGVKYRVVTREFTETGMVVIKYTEEFFDVN